MEGCCHATWAHHHPWDPPQARAASAKCGEGHYACAPESARTAEALMPCGLRGAPLGLERASGTCARIVRPRRALNVKPLEICNAPNGRGFKLKSLWNLYT